MLHGFPVLALLICLWAPSVAAGPRCNRSYVSSPLEERWLRHIKQWQSPGLAWTKGCAAHKADQPKLNVWLKQVMDDRQKPQAMREDIFSHHVVHCEGQASQKQFLEPLAVALRSPIYPCVSNTARGLFDTSYLFFPYATELPHSRAYFFDAGSTVFDSGVRGYKDSLQWFMDVYRDRGFAFSEIFAWEVKPLNGTQYWERVPAEFKHRVHFFNTAASSDPQSAMNPLSLIQQVARPEDFVVFKLDIDNNEVEVQLIQQLLHDPALIALVDELFWENHVRNHPMHFEGVDHLHGPCTTLADSYRCFRQMRAAGIRAHSWI